MPPIERAMMRCAACRRWWSVGPGEVMKCACGGDLEIVDMKAHIASLPQGGATHSHLTKGLQPVGTCDACDREHLAAREAAKLAKP
jgi:hypothetical protein